MNRRNYVAVIGSIGAALTLALGGTAHAADQKAPGVSPCLAKPLKAAQDALNAQKYDLEIQKIHEAQSAKCTKTAFDNYLMNSWLGVAYINQKNYNSAAPALQAAAESQYSSGDNRKKMLQAVVTIYTQLQQYPKAMEAIQAASRLGAADSTMYVTVAVSQDHNGQHKEAAATIQQLIDKEGKPEEKYLEFQWEAYNKANDPTDASKIIDKLVTLYPKPDYWLNALQPLLKMNISDARLQLDVYRLMFDVGVLTRPQDVAEMAQLTFDAGFPGETVAVLQMATDKKIFTDPRDVLRYQHLLMSAMTKAQADQGSLASQESKAQSAETGDPLVALGAAYLSYGQADKAASIIAMGIAKGGLKSTEQANLLLGIAQLHSHNAAAARRTFDKVASSSNQGYAQLGHLWSLRAASHSVA